MNIFRGVFKQRIVSNFFKVFVYATCSSNSYYNLKRDKFIHIPGVGSLIEVAGQNFYKNLLTGRTMQKKVFAGHSF